MFTDYTEATRGFHGFCIYPYSPPCIPAPFREFRVQLWFSRNVNNLFTDYTEATRRYHGFCNFLFLFPCIPAPFRVLRGQLWFLPERKNLFTDYTEATRRFHGFFWASLIHFRVVRLFSVNSVYSSGFPRTEKTCSRITRKQPADFTDFAILPNYSVTSGSIPCTPWSALVFPERKILVHGFHGFCNLPFYFPCTPALLREFRGLLWFSPLISQISRNSQKVLLPPDKLSVFR